MHGANLTLCPGIEQVFFPEHLLLLQKMRLALIAEPFTHGPGYSVTEDSENRLPNSLLNQWLSTLNDPAQPCSRSEAMGPGLHLHGGSQT